jgi:hypothetical protein
MQQVSFLITKLLIHSGRTGVTGQRTLGGQVSLSAECETLVKRFYALFLTRCRATELQNH